MKVLSIIQQQGHSALTARWMVSRALERDDLFAVLHLPLSGIRKDIRYISLASIQHPERHWLCLTCLYPASGKTSAMLRLPQSSIRRDIRYGISPMPHMPLSSIWKDIRYASLVSIQHSKRHPLWHLSYASHVSIQHPERQPLCPLASIQHPKRHPLCHLSYDRLWLNYNMPNDPMVIMDLSISHEECERRQRSRVILNKIVTSLCHLWFEWAHLGSQYPKSALDQRSLKLFWYNRCLRPQYRRLYGDSRLRSVMNDVKIHWTPVFKKETCRQLTAANPLTSESFDAVTSVSAESETIFNLLV